MEIGLSSFGAVVPEGVAGGAVQTHVRMQDLLEEMKVADEVGLDVFALGEHHRPDFIISAPEVILAAAATITQRIKLSSAVTVLSSADPVRTFQNFASLDLISNGRAEIMAGRGSFIESFPLFGYSLDDYDALFFEKLDLLLKINQSEKISWKGKFRASLQDQGVYPRPLQPQLPVWLAIGGTPASAVRAGKLNLPMTIAILGGAPDRFQPLADLYRQTARQHGHDVNRLQLAINAHFYVADTTEQAVEEFYTPYEQLMNRIGRERGWPPMSREQFEYNRQYGPLMVGSPEELIQKTVRIHRIFGNTRFIYQIIGEHYIPHEKMLHAIRLLGEVVAPEAKRLTEVK